MTEEREEVAEENQAKVRSKKKKKGSDDSYSEDDYSSDDSRPAKKKKSGGSKGRGGGGGYMQEMRLSEELSAVVGIRRAPRHEELFGFQQQQRALQRVSFLAYIHHHHRGLLILHSSSSLPAWNHQSYNHLQSMNRHFPFSSFLTSHFCLVFLGHLLSFFCHHQNLNRQSQSQMKPPSFC